MLRWAIVGTGFISHTVAAAIEASDGSVLHSVAGRNADSVAQFASAHGIAVSSIHTDDLIADPAVDVVYVGLPNHVHHEVAIAASSAGKAVLSEKSLTRSMATAHELVDAVRDQGFFVEGLMYLAHPFLGRYAELLNENDFGHVRAVSGRYSAPIANVVNPHGGGTIYNLGCYPVSLLHLTMQVACGADAWRDWTLRAVGTRTTDGTFGHAVASIEFGNGVLATLQSTDNFGMGHDFVVMTDRGELRFETNPWLPVAGENRLVFAPYEGDPTVIAVHDERDAFFHQVKLVERAVAAGRTEVERPSPRLDDSLEIMAMLTEWEGQLDRSSPQDAPRT